MKPDASEFTGIVPFNEHEGFDASARNTLDLLDSMPLFALSNLTPEEVVHLHTATGNISLMFSFERRLQTGSASTATVVSTTIDGVSEGEVIRVDGTSAGASSLIKLGFLGQYGSLAFSRFPKREIQGAELDFVRGLDEEALAKASFISCEDGVFYASTWDGNTYYTGEILTAERQRADEEPIPIFS